MLFDCSKKDVFWTMDEKKDEKWGDVFWKEWEIENVVVWTWFWVFWVEWNQESWMNVRNLENNVLQWICRKAWDFDTFDIGCESILKSSVTLCNSSEMLIKGLISETKHYWSVLEGHVKVKSRKMFLMIWSIVNKMWFEKLAECHFESCCGSLSKQDNWNGNYLWTWELGDTRERIERNMFH